MPRALLLPSNEQLEAASRQLSHEIEKRRKVELKLRHLNATLDQQALARTAQLQSILDAVSDALIIIDRQGIMQSFNATAERLFGHSADEAYGRNVSILMPAPERDEHCGYLERYL